MSIKSLSRRSFVKITASSLTVIPLVVGAQEDQSDVSNANPKLPEDDPVAISLGYKEKSSNVDSGLYPNHQETQKCSGCSLYVVADEAWGDCAVFPGKQVAAEGWCAAYVAKPT